MRWTQRDLELLTLSAASPGDGDGLSPSSSLPVHDRLLLVDVEGEVLLLAPLAQVVNLSPTGRLGRSGLLFLSQPTGSSQEEFLFPRWLRAVWSGCRPWICFAGS